MNQTPLRQALEAFENGLGHICRDILRTLIERAEQEAEAPSSLEHVAGETFDQWLKREQPAGCVSDMERGWKACAESWNVAQVNKPELVKWQYRWLNPRKCQDANDEELAWMDVELTWPHKTFETKVKELEEYRLSGMVLYECRPLYAGPRPPSVDGPVEEKEN